MTTMDIREKDRNFKNTSTEEVKSISGGDALGEKLSEWLETPRGSITDNPGWGNELRSIQFETDSTAAVIAESFILGGIRRDIPDITITGVFVEWGEIDQCRIKIQHQSGEFSGSVSFF